MITEKYYEFNIAVQDILCGRMLTPGELSAYYKIIETNNIDEGALLLIIKYCAEHKGPNVGSPYIITVANNWISEGLLSVDEVKNRINFHNNQTTEIKTVLKALNLNRQATTHDNELLKKWTTEFGFKLEVVKYVAREKSKLHYNIERLDNLLSNYFKMNIFTIEDIYNYEITFSENFLTAKTIIKNLGLFYDNLEPVISEYVIQWLSLGYDKETIIVISKYCFAKSIRTLDGMNRFITKLFKLKITSMNALTKYLISIKDIDIKIYSIFEKLDIKRTITSTDRTNYKTWTEIWNMPPALIEYAITLANGKTNSVAYINKLLSCWHESKIKTVSDAENYLKILHFEPNILPKKKNEIISHDYSKEELNMLFDSIDEIKI